MEPNKYSKYTVITRKGNRQPLDISIVRRRMEDLAFGLDLKFVNLDLVLVKVQQGLHDQITTAQLDNLAAETCAYMVLFCLFRILSTLITAYQLPDSRQIILERKQKIQLNKLLTNYITVKTRLVGMLLCQGKMYMTLFAKITKKLTPIFLFSAILHMIILVSKLSKGHIY